MAEIVRSVPHTTEMICAAYLHDVVEDTPITIEQIQEKFGDTVAGLVGELTDVYVKEDYRHLNRRERKKKEVERQSTMSKDAKTIKLADVIDNTGDILKNDRDFARRYIPEMQLLVEALQGGNFKLLMRACYEVQRGKFELNLERQKISTV